MNATAVAEKIEIGVTTDVGRVRELNEDTVLAMAPGDGPGNPWLLSAVLAVADGMGGHQAGEVASKLAGDMVRQAFVSPEENSASRGDGSGESLLARLTATIKDVNRVVHSLGDGVGLSRPGTTLTVCLTRPGNYFIGHVGDSRAYLARQDDIVQLTEDDSWVAEALRRGQLSETEAENSPFQNQLTKSIGTSPEVEPSVYEGAWGEGDVLILCSDGLIEYVPPAEMHQLARSELTLQGLCDEMVRRANDRGGHDNISVVAARSGIWNGNGGRGKPTTWPPINAAPATTTLPSTGPISASSTSNASAAILPKVGPSLAPEPDTLELPSSARPSGYSSRKAAPGAVSPPRKVDPLKIMLALILSGLIILAGVWAKSRYFPKDVPVVPVSMGSGGGAPLPLLPAPAPSTVRELQVTITPASDWSYLLITCRGGRVRPVPPPPGSRSNKVKPDGASERILLGNRTATQNQIKNRGAQIICDGGGQNGSLDSQHTKVVLNASPRDVYTVTFRAAPPSNYNLFLAGFKVFPAAYPLTPTTGYARNDARRTNFTLRQSGHAIPVMKLPAPSQGIH